MDTPIVRTFDEYVAWLAANSPAAGILEWWRRLDRALDDYGTTLKFTTPNRVRVLEDAISADPDLGPDVARHIRSMRRLRNRVAHDQVVHLSQEEVTAFASQALHLIWEVGTRRAR